VGKSTLMNLLSKSEVFAENKLFATVDSTVRKVVIGQVPFLLTDTVGFIKKLPHTLIECFKSTLDEIREADILLHVVDVSHPNYEEHIQVVNETLQEIGIKDKPTLLVLNKIDQLGAEEEEGSLEVAGKDHPPVGQLKQTVMGKREHPAVFISAQKKQNITELRQKLFEVVQSEHMKIYPHYLEQPFYELWKE
jgi:GTP-binding protein HflX